MKCPYMKSIETHVQHCVQQDDEDGEKASTHTVDQWSYELMDCLEEECAVWREGHCFFNDR